MGKRGRRRHGEGGEEHRVAGVGTDRTGTLEQFPGLIMEALNLKLESLLYVVAQTLSNRGG